MISETNIRAAFAANVKPNPIRKLDIKTSQDREIVFICRNMDRAPMNMLTD